jgi:hypothetical protein
MFVATNRPPGWIWLCVGAGYASRIRLDRGDLKYRTAGCNRRRLDPNFRAHRCSDCRHDYSGERGESSPKTRPVSSTPCHRLLDFLVEHDGVASDGNARMSPTRIGINHPERADEEGGSGHTGAQRNASLRERTGYCLLFRAPAQVIRYPDQQTDQDMERGTEVMISSHVALKLPEVGLDLGTSCLTPRQ